VFERVYGSESIHLAHRWCLANINDATHVFAGKEHFHQFDLIRRRPTPIEKLAVVEDLFFDNVTPQDEPFFTENPNTKELWMFLPEGAGKVIAYDWEEDTVSTIDASFSAAAQVTPPLNSYIEEVTDRWFLLGGFDSRVLIHGVDQSGEAVLIPISTVKPFKGSMRFSSLSKT